MAKHKVDITGINTADLKVLTQDEMIELFKKLNDGDENAKKEISEGNLRLVLSTLRNFTGRCDNMDDLFQVGVIGLMKAIDNFDLKFNVKFSTYAVPMIIGEVKRYLRDNNIIRVSRSMKDIAYKTLKLKEQIFMETGIEPTIEELANKLEIDEVDILCALDATKSTVSVFEPIYNDGGETIYLFDQLENKNETSNNWNDKLLLENAIKKLKTKEQFIIIQRFIMGMTQMEISDELGISQAQVSRIEKNAINNVKKLVK